MMFNEKWELRRKFRAEVDLAAVYDALASIQQDPDMRRRYEQLAGHERENAAGILITLWENGATVPAWHRTLRGRLYSALVRSFGAFETRARRPQ